MESMIMGLSLIEVEPYLVGFAAGFIAHRLYLVNRWRFAEKKNSEGWDG